MAFRVSAGLLGGWLVAVLAGRPDGDAIHLCLLGGLLLLLLAFLKARDAAARGHTSDRGGHSPLPPPPSASSARHSTARRLRP